MKSKAQKKESIDALTKALPESSIVIFSTFARQGEAGLSVAQMRSLKRALRQEGGQYLVAKKTLVEKVLKDLKYDGVDVYAMEGSMGIVVGPGDAYALAKALYQSTKAAPALKLLGAWLEGHFVTREQLIEIATMPGREELLARLLGMLKYPLSSLAVVMNEIAKKKAVATA